MSTIININGTTGEDWISWPVGSPLSGLDAIAQRFADSPDLLTDAHTSITQLDERLDEAGATIGGVWAPEEFGGHFAALWWAGVRQAPSEEEYRSARRYERMVNDGYLDSTGVMYSRQMTTIFVDDTEAILTIESRADGDGCRPYLRARAVYFPTQTKDRVILEVTNPSFSLVQDFVNNVTAMASSLHIITSDT
ncbi:MAG: hypothetical protein FWD55_08250 [Propionibacteriaceae bacterium]|nr:hypothetical protein [Propionibacteriaceae bacterium]